MTSRGRAVLRRGVRTIAAVSLLTALSGCPGKDWITYNTAVIDGNVTLIVVNDTPHRAIFTAATWNDLDRPDLRNVNLQPLRIEGNTTSPSQTLPCARNFAIATQTLVDWVSHSRAFANSQVDTAALNATVFFSDVPTGGTGTDSPTAGTAAGIELLVGIDYSCGDQIIATLTADPDAAGGFRVDYEVIQDIR